MAEHTYKPGEPVAVKAMYDAPPISGIDRHCVLAEWGRDEVVYVDDDQLAPFLSVEAQSSLLRVARAALWLDDEFTTGRGGLSGSLRAHSELRNARAALSPELLTRVARLSEGE